MKDMGKGRRKALAIGRRVPIQSIVLRTLFVTGVVGGALLAPNAVRFFKHIDRGAAGRKRLYQRIGQARERLAEKGLISITGVGRDTKIALTKQGEGALREIFANNYPIPEPALWDGKWRIVMFDVREKRKRVRSMLRAMLRGAGFVWVQDSVWIHPYPCDEFVELMRSHLKSGVGEMLHITADAFAGDTRLREHFDLKIK